MRRYLGCVDSQVTMLLWAVQISAVEFFLTMTRSFVRHNMCNTSIVPVCFAPSHTPIPSFASLPFHFITARH